MWHLERLVDVLDGVISALPRPRSQTEPIMAVIANFLPNAYYSTEEAYLYALAEVSDL